MWLTERKRQLIPETRGSQSVSHEAYRPIGRNDLLFVKKMAQMAERV